MTAIWTHGELMAAMAATSVGPMPEHVRGISIDTRTIGAGELFFAIRGDSRDGHAFVPDALRAGSAAVVAGNYVDGATGDGPLYVVDDPLTALQRLAAAARRRCDASIVAVTGSVGKTSTKEALRHVLAAQGPTHASVLSYNNHWGVPLTLARMPVTTRYGVFEIGMSSAFEILPLTTMVRPHSALITTVEPVHLAQFQGVEGIADAKGEIFAGVEEGGTAIVCRDNPHFERLRAHASASAAGRIVTFGEHAAADVRLVKLVMTPDLSVVEASVFGQSLTYRVGSPGRHMALNSLAVLAAVHTVGADIALAGIALGGLSPSSGRGRRVQCDAGSGLFTLLDESYNANPASMRAALALLGQMSMGLRGRRIAVLGDMLELGPAAPHMHRDLIEAITANHIDLVFAAGPLMRNLWEELPFDCRGVHAETAADLEEALAAAIRSGDAVVVKGSNGSRMGPLVAALKRRFPVVDDGAASQD